jgi:phosphate transport system substrate-binding protein
LTRRLFFYTSPSPQNSLVGKFVAFVQSDTGQKILDREGFVGSITSIAMPRKTSRNLPSGAPSGYRALVDLLDQAGFNFYFNTGSNVLDNKALVDVGRLVEIVSNGAIKNRAVILAGFADSTGSRDLNLKLSEDRAKSVARELVAQRVRVKATMGFGQELPN